MVPSQLNDWHHLAKSSYGKIEEFIVYQYSAAVSIAPSWLEVRYLLQLLSNALSRNLHNSAGKDHSGDFNVTMLRSLLLLICLIMLMVIYPRRAINVGLIILFCRPR